MLTRTEGIVIKRIPYTDSSAVVHIYTKENGLVPFLVQGLGKAKSKVAYYQIGQLLEINYNHKSSGGLNRIREVTLLNGYQLPVDFHKQQLLFFYIEVFNNRLRRLMQIMISLILQYNNSRISNRISTFHGRLLFF